MRSSNPASLCHRFAAVPLLALLLFAAPLSGQDEATRTLVTADRLIDGFGNVQEPGAVLVEGERIVAVGSAARDQAHDDRVDLGDATLMPGLIDLHTHLTDAEDAYWERVLVTTTPAEAALYGAANALTTLRSGFTTVRDMGPAWSFTDVDLRNII
ncbi:MAG: amidohydrolase family protein, partial [Gemmatimonadota bacterium]|nr:amidohydrolase family protein [Gemmatimonadota bacterium]